MKKQTLKHEAIYLNKSCWQVPLFVVIVSFTGGTKYGYGDFTNLHTKEISLEKCFSHYFRQFNLNLQT